MAMFMLGLVVGAGIPIAIAGILVGIGAWAHAKES